jgi:glycerol uptake facilitator-like aquaporin
VKRQAAAEFIGSLLLAAAVIGSGIAAEKLAGGNVAIALLANALATGAMLYVLIVVFAEISGAHFNPAVSIALAWRRAITPQTAAVYIAAQIIGMIAGAWLAHLMFDLPVLQFSSTPREGMGLFMGEIVATAGLVFTIITLAGRKVETVASAVALYIVAAYWFTSSTSFANPAITIARSLSDSFAGIAPSSAPAFIAAQMAGTICALLIARLFSATSSAAR